LIQQRIKIVILLREKERENWKRYNNFRKLIVVSVSALERKLLVESNLIIKDSTFIVSKGV